MDIKTYLGRYNLISKKIDNLVFDLEQKSDLLDRVQNNMHNQEAYIDYLRNDLQRLCDKIRKEIDDLTTARDEIKTALNKIPDEQGQLILYYRFCMGKTETETASLLGYKNRSIVTKATPKLIEEFESILGE